LRFRTGHCHRGLVGYVPMGPPDWEAEQA